MDDDDDDDVPCPTGRFAAALNQTVSYHLDEYDLTAATVVGVLTMELFRRLRDIFSDDDEYEDQIMGDTAHIVRALATQIEVRILAGCDSCGRRLVGDNGRLRAGSMVLDCGNDDRPFCRECAECVS